MKMKFNGTAPEGFENFCIREYIAEVRERDGKKCCPFNLSSDCEEYTYQAEIVYALLLETGDALVNIRENIEALNSKSHDAVIHHDVVYSINGDGPLESSSSKVKDDAPCDSENRISENTMATGNNRNTVMVDNGENTTYEGPSGSACIEVNDAQCQDGESVGKDVVPSKKDRKQKNTRQRKPQRFRLLSDIYKELDAASIVNNESECGSDTEEDSYEITLDTFIKKVKYVRVTSKRIGAMKNKRAPHDVEPRIDRAKWTKPMSENSCSKDSIIGLTHQYYLRKDKISEVDMRVMNKRKRLSAESIVLENSGAPYSLESQKNTCGSQKRIRESFSPSDDETMAALQLLRLFHEGENAKTSSKNATQLRFSSISSIV